MLKRKQIGYIREEEEPKNIKEYKDIQTTLLNTYIEKNNDYGDSFKISCDEEGLAASRIRLGDKWLRFKNLSKNDIQLVKDESITDTLMDMANYCIMTIMWLNSDE